MDIEAIREHVRAGQYKFSDHVILRGEIIEEYTGDKYSPSCLICGRAGQGRSLHVQVSLPPLVVVVTAYEPDADKWIDEKTRRQEL